MSVLVTVRNEEKNLPALLSSLAGQRHLAEVVLVDAASTDGTVAVAREFAKRMPITILSQPCTRGEGRNIAASKATGDLFAFIDGDCVADPDWLAQLVGVSQGAPDMVVAGWTHVQGRKAFTNLHRVELQRRGQDTTWPSCNLLYPRALFRRLGGFDPAFVTAEDIEINYRAVGAGAQIVPAPAAVVHAKARDSLIGFLRQGYWNGFGRKQLTRKHGRLWGEYRLGRMLRQQATSPWGLARLGAGAAGYIAAKLGRSPSRKRRRPE